MLGGSVYIALIRFAISLVGVIILFTQISQSRFQKKKTILYYGIFCMAYIYADVYVYRYKYDICAYCIGSCSNNLFLSIDAV